MGSQKSQNIQEHSEWGSRYDPRRIAQTVEERNRSLKPASQSFASFLSTMPSEVKQRVLINRRIQQVHEQFAQVVDPFILDHTNSVYLLKQKETAPLQDTNNTAQEASSSGQGNKGSDKNSYSSPIYDLVVYVDNSMCAAELNARRELIRLKYREEFNTIIDVFEIRISRGSYKDNYPFKDKKYQQQTPQARQLSVKECEEVDELVESLPEGRMKDSFIEAIKAQKRFSDEK